MNERKAVGRTSSSVTGRLRGRTGVLGPGTEGRLVSPQREQLREQGSRWARGGGDSRDGFLLAFSFPSLPLYRVLQTAASGGEMFVGNHSDGTLRKIIYSWVLIPKRNKK